MNLYEMSTEFEHALDDFDVLLNPGWDKTPEGNYITDDGELLTPEEYNDMIEERFTALDGMEQDIQIKAENVALYVKHLTADINEMKAEEKNLIARRKAKENTAARLKVYLMNCMESANLKKIDRPKAVISIRNNAESVEISDTEKFIKWAHDNDRDDLLKYTDPEIRKSAVKPLLQDGEKIPFATLTRTQSVVIK